MSKHILATGGLCALAFVAPASADIVTVTIENTNPDEGFFFTPFWFAVHNGGFNTFDVGDFAYNFPGLTELAENGNTGPISAAFLDSSAGRAGGRDFTLTANDIGPPVFNPGESASVDFDIGDSTVNRFFSFASMVIPSNDLFVGNDNATGLELFDAAGNFNGPVEILIFGRDIYDNGTEVNNAFGDAAFSANDGQAQPEFNPIRNFFTDPGDQEYLDSFLGTETASGDFINRSFGPDDLVARITIVPAPGAFALLAVAGLISKRKRVRD